MSTPAGPPDEPPPLPYQDLPDSAPPPLPGEHPGAAAVPRHESPGSMPGADPLPEIERLPDPGALTDPGRLHDTEQSRTYPCEACGAGVVYDPSDGQLRCRHCGTARPVALPEGATVTSHDLVSTMSALYALAGNPSQDAQLSRELVCQSCGGITAFDGSTVATRCPFCATPIQREEFHDAPERLPLDGIIPFQLDEAAARASIQEWIDKRWFAPREFKKYRELGSFSSVYLTYFNYESDTITDYTGQRGVRYTRTEGIGDNRRTVTETRWSPASGTVENVIQDMPELANTGVDRELVSELEPWPLTYVVPYTPQFVAGHLARTYDEDAQQRFDRGAQARIEDRITRSIRADIGGDEQRISSHDTRYRRLAFAQLLFPVWLLTVIYAGRPFQVYINGVTGEVHGERPWSKPKIIAAVVAAVVLAILAFVLVRRFR